MALDGLTLDNSGGAPENATVAVAGRQRGIAMGFARALATVFFILSLPIALITTNVRLLVNAPLVYDYAFDRYDAVQTTSLSRPDIDSTAGALRRYFNNGEKTFYHTVTEDGLPAPVFNARETRHMEDVKALIVKLNRAQEISAVYVLAYVVAFFIWAREGNLRQLAVQAMLGLTLGVLAVGSVGAMAAFGFEGAWERFHGVAFDDDLWRLNPRTDHLIQMFPEPFWRDMTVLLGAMCALEALLIGVVSAVYLMGTRGEPAAQRGGLDVAGASTQAA